ncbi:hypothetical protein ES708_00008 [subsurface metagenome]
MWRPKDDWEKNRDYWLNTVGGKFADSGEAMEASVIYEAGADAQGEAILKLCEELQDGVKDSECFSYGGPTMCEYRCLPGLIEILRGKQCSGAER